MNTRTTQKGFTIIEVVLVLAIAALIFLMIFIALPALQRGQRDTARKQDIGTIASAVNTYRSNHRGSLPAAGTSMSTYIDELSQIDSTSITVKSGVANGAAPALDKAYIYIKSVCADDNTATTSGASSRQAAVVTKVESGDTYCQEV